MISYRAKIYRTFGLPGKPKVRLAIGFGPWVDQEKRAQNLVNLLNKINPQNDTWLQIVRIAS